MKNVIIRPATLSDIPTLAKLWREKAVVQQQTDRRFTLLSGGELKWSSAVAEWLADGRCMICVGEHEDSVVGYAVGWVQDSPPGLSPEKIGVVTDMAVGLHSYQSGLGRMLLDALRTWFVEQDIMQVLAQVPRRQPVEQAFWRALGATEYIDVMWMKL